MMKRIVLAVVCCLAFTAARAEDGKAIFAAKCAACHGPDGKGQTVMGKKMGVKDLTTLKDSEADVQKVVENGKPPKMTAFKGKLSDSEIKAVAQYVKASLAK